jgi:hypothetical protein
MNEQGTVLILSTLVGLCALALLIQVICLIATYGVVRRLQKSSAALIAKINELARISKEAAAEQKQRFGEIKATSLEIVKILRVELARLDDLYSDVKLRFLNQKDRAELVLDDTIRRVTQPVTVVRRGILSPVRRFQGIFAGVRNAVTTFRRRVSAA